LRLVELAPDGVEPDAERAPRIRVEALDFSRAAGPSQPLLLEVRGLSLPGQQVDRWTLSLQAGDRWVVQSQVSGPELELALEGSAEQRDGEWRGSLTLLELAQGEWPKVQLQAPAAWRWAQPQGALESACLGIEGGQLCMTGSIDETGLVEVQATPDGLDLSLLNPALGASGVELVGLLDGSLQLQWSAAQGATASGSLSIAQLLATFPAPDGVERLEKRAALELRLLPPDSEDSRQRIAALLDFAELGSLNLQLAGQPWGDAPELDVELRSSGLDLVLLDGVHPELVNPRGQLMAELQLRQRLGQWAGEGRLSLSEGALELPLAGLQLEQLALQLEATPAGEFRLSGTGRSGEGGFELAGNYPLDPAADANLSIKGDSVLVVNLPIVRMEASPDLQVSRRQGRVNVKGSVLIPSALIDLARFEPTVRRSPDVVVIDDPPQEVGLPLALSADIRLEMGESVRLKGFGLDGRLSGALSVRERPGRPTTGRGELNVTGQYRAYGQDLKISRGKLLFSGGPLESPGLDLLAVREVGSIEAGVRVRGEAGRPELSIFSDPPMDQAEAFSLLVLGRPLNSASGDDSQQLGAAAAALGSAAGGLIASRLGSGTGLAVEVESSADLGGAALTVGRYITPKIYFGVGRSLFDDIQVAILRYRLTSSIELEALSGREFKGGVNYRLER
jgi:translocation and assembly module TamB